MKPRRLICLGVGLAMLAAAGCSTESTRGAAEGAASGAAIGAVGGMVTALVFGGDIGDAAARGAVWGGSTGAVSGGIRGAQVAERNQAAADRKREEELARLRRNIGEDSFRGLEALVECKFPVAVAYAETAQNDSNPDFALAGFWLEALTVAEQGRTDEVEAMIPELVRKDPKLTTETSARTLLEEATTELGDIREDNGSGRNCS